MGVLRAKVGGSWVDIGAVGTDEVYVGATTPVDAAVELWYDTAAVPAVDPVKMPRGWVGHGYASAGQTNVNGTADVPGCSVTWTADSTRRYKTTFTIGSQTILGANGQLYAMIANAANGQLRSVVADVSVNQVMAFCVVLIEMGLSGAQTRKARLSGGGGNWTSNGTTEYGGLIIVEDIGGV